MPDAAANGPDLELLTVNGCHEGIPFPQAFPLFQLRTKRLVTPEEDAAAGDPPSRAVVRIVGTEIQNLASSSGCDFPDALHMVSRNVPASDLPSQG